MKIVRRFLVPVELQLGTKTFASMFHPQIESRHASLSMPRNVTPIPDISGYGRDVPGAEPEGPRACPVASAIGVKHARHISRGGAFEADETGFCAADRAQRVL